MLTAFVLFAAMGIPQSVKAQDVIPYTGMGMFSSKNNNQNAERESSRENLNKLDQQNASQQTFNPVGKWVNKNDNNQIKDFKSDHTYISLDYNKGSITVKGTDITYPRISRTWRGTWSVEGNVLIQTSTQFETSIGDISYYPAADQQRIKDDVRDREKNYEPHTYQYIINKC